MSHFWTVLSSLVLAFVGVFLMFIILLQRGRGGGLAGAFGGAGGQSAFGTKAGDVFTRITIVVAIIWVAMAALTGFAMKSERGGYFQPSAREGALEPGPGGAAKEVPIPSAEKAGEGGAPAKTPSSPSSSSAGEKKSTPPAKSNTSPAGSANEGARATDAKSAPAK